MLGGTVNGGDFSGLLGMLKRLAQPDLRPLAEEIKRIVLEGNEAGLLAGLDADGVPFAELKDSTIEGRVRREGGYGPPLVPRFSASRLIDRFRVVVEPIAGGGFSIQGSWPGCPEVEFFRTGTVHMAKRNPVGIRPETSAKIQAAVDDFTRSLIGGQSRFGGTSGF
jgi:hypothetical protein